MHEIHNQAVELQSDLLNALRKIDFDALLAQKKMIDEQTLQPDFWSDPAAAQEVAKKQSKLERRIMPWTQLKQEVADIAELSEIGDADMTDDLAAQLQEAQEKYTTLKDDLKFSGPYDDNDIIIGIYAGAGGADAQDWAGMLLRMYVRWAEKSGYSVQTLDESMTEEGGIKSVTLELAGSFAYGKLKGEHGVHRLVRLSPFNAESRETSFAKVDILPKVDQPDALIIDDKDLRIDVYRSGGHGGQSVNTTDSAVRITHIPTGIAVAIQNERSQLQNKEVAMTILRSRLIQLQMEQHLEKVSELKGPNQSAEWGNQIRSYVLHPYKQVKDLRSRYETSDVDGVLDGNIDQMISAYLEHNLGQ
jgi:peptide chain release factor 2